MGFNVNIAGISLHYIFFDAFIERLIRSGIPALKRIQGTKVIIAMFVFDAKEGVFIDRGHCYSFRLKSLRIFSTRRRLTPRSEYPNREADFT